MVKKKSKSKRTTLKDKYKIQRRVAETHRKKKKQAKRGAKNGIVRPNQQKRDPGIPNSWPFKQDLLKDIQRARERQQQQQQFMKQKRKNDLQSLQNHIEEGGECRTIKDLMIKAAQENQAYANKQNGDRNITADSSPTGNNEKSDGRVADGQQSRRAYLRQLKKVVESADVLLQVLDARDPIGSRIHKSMEEMILSQVDKRMVLVLNKIDLVPKEVVSRWLTVLRRSHPTIAIKASKDMPVGSGKDAMTSSSPAGMDGLLQLLKNYARGYSGGKSKTTIVCGVIGYPNTGKSSLINALKRSKVVGVSSRAGFTTSMQEVVLDRTVRLLDCPGVIFSDESALLGNCVDADSIDDPIPPVDALLQRCSTESLMMTYNIPAFRPGDTMMFLAMVAKSYGRVLKGGIPDKNGAARAVLKDWNHGKIPYFTVPPPDIEPNVQKGDAVIVSSFGAEFDLSNYDNEVLGSFKDSDELDYIQLTSKEPMITNEYNLDLEKRTKEISELLSIDKNESENDHENMTDDDNAEIHDDISGGSADFRMKISEAEDFDFKSI